jgi:hypothetical protein
MSFRCEKKPSRFLATISLLRQQVVLKSVNARAKSCRSVTRKVGSMLIHFSQAIAYQDDHAVFTDIQGNELFALQNKHLSLHKSFHAEGPNGKDIFLVKGHFSRELFSITFCFEQHL